LVIKRVHSKLRHVKATIFPAPFSQLGIPRLLRNNMVLQRDTDIRIWGWAKAGTTVTIGFRDKSYSAIAGADGKWAVILSQLKAGGPCSMKIKAGIHIIIVRNILVGDVWVCSGQSNMGLPMSRVKDVYADEIACARNPAIRQFVVAEKYDFNTPQDDLESGGWEPLNPGSVLGFSAVGHFFAKTLYDQYQVPVGLISASLGGAPAEAFLSEAALKEFPAYLATAQKFKNYAYLDRIRQENQARNDTWYDRIQREDRGLGNSEKPWYDPEYDASAWPTMQVPAFWDDEGLLHGNGVVWFRKEIVLQDEMTGLPARLFLGRIVDSDTVYVNGINIGTTGYQYPPRIYDIPANLLKAGQNTIVIRVVNTSGRGGFIKDKPYYLTAGGKSIDLKGEWRLQIGVAAPPLPEPLAIQWQPAGLFNGMIAPLIHYAIKGVIWYQGESNTERAQEYRRLFPALITDWREKWGRGDFPFLYVQLPNYMPADDRPSESAWAKLRDAQRRTLAVPNTGMAVTIDTGEWNDLHPLNKKDVGCRLALIAQKVAYGEKDLVDSGPLYRAMRIADGRITVTFSNTGGGLMIKGGGELKGFAIAGRDQKYVWAKAKIAGDQVVAWNEQVSQPVALRYAWADNPEGANLYNAEGLPASPFTTEP
jgi:sialate O-acetylesterase